MTRAPAALRGALFLGLLLSAGLPLVLLAVASVGRAWFWPALLPAEWDAEAWRRVVDAGGRLGRAGAASVALAVATGTLATAVAVPVGRALAGLRGWRRAVAAGAAFLPVAAPPIALGAGLQVSFLALGLGGTFAGVLLAHLVPAVGYLSLYFLGVFSVWDARVEDEARSLGASTLDVLGRVTLPLLRPALATAWALGFLISWAQVPLTLLVGGGLVPTLPVEVLAYVQAGQDRFAATGALLLFFPALLALAAARAAARGAEVVPA